MTEKTGCFQLDSKKLISQVNGGLGPGYGLIGLIGEPKLHGLNLVVHNQDGVNARPPKPYQPWPAGFIEVCDWGDGITSALRRADAAAPYSGHTVIVMKAGREKQ